MSDADSALPPLLRRWVEPMFGPIAGEPRATCLDCAMTNRVDRPMLEFAFDPHVKCCTYQPDVPNFSVGAILGDTDAASGMARSMLRQRIIDRVGVTPFGVHVPPVYRTIFENAGPAFGRSRFMRCPYYVDRDGGLCGIWRHRDSVCSTWFCKHDAGAMGKVYWQVVRSVLAQIEMSVKLWAVTEAGLDEKARANLWSRMEYDKLGVRPPMDLPALAGSVDEGRYREDWGNFAGRELELFARCAERVVGLSSEDVLRLGGMHLRAALDAALYVREKLESSELPGRVTAGGMTYYQIRKPGEVRLRHQNVKLDWLDLPESVARELGRFTRGPVREVLAELQAEGVPVDEELVRRLLHWQALMEA